MAEPPTSGMPPLRYATLNALEQFTTALLSESPKPRVSADRSSSPRGQSLPSSTKNVSRAASSSTPQNVQHSTLQDGTFSGTNISKGILATRSGQAVRGKFVSRIRAQECSRLLQPQVTQTLLPGFSIPHSRVNRN